MNDDGSGSAALLETAEQMKATGVAPRNKVRFIFFAAREQGLLGIGSLRLPADEAADQRHLGDARLRHARIRNYAGSSTTATATTRCRRPERLRHHRAGVQGLVRQRGPGLRDDPVRRALRLRRVHPGRHPGGGIFAGAEEIKSRSRCSCTAEQPGRIRPVLPPALRHPREHQPQGLASARTPRSTRS